MPGRWVVARAHFDVPASRYGESSLYLSSIAGATGRWVAFGTAGIDEVSWYSRDGRTWLVSSHPPTGGVSDVLVDGARLLAVGSVLSRTATDVQSPTIWQSGDGGASWSTISTLSVAPAAGGSIGAIARIGGRVVVGATTSSPQQASSAPAAWYSDDLNTFHRASVPAVPANADESMGAVTVTGERVIAIGGQFPSSLVWASDDRGVSWNVLHPGLDAEVARPLLARAGSALVAVSPFVPDRVQAPNRRYGWSATIGRPDAWKPAPDDAGQFGDGMARVFGLDAFGRHAIALAGISARDNPAFCYDDLATCKRGATVLLASADGQRWDRAEVPDSSGAGFRLLGVDQQSIMLLGFAHPPTNRPAALPDTVWTWTSATSATPPTTHEPTPHPKPSPHPLVTRYDATLVDGRTYRFEVPIGGGCGAGYLSFGGRTWLVDQPWGEAPYPRTWPTRHEFVADAPTDYLYATVTQRGDRIDAGIEGGPTLRTYHATSVRPRPCG